MENLKLSLITPLLALFLAGLLMTGSTLASPLRGEPSRPALTVVGTTTQIQDFARTIGGDRIVVLGILPAGADLHDYQLTAEDARKIAQADLILYNGAGLEPWLGDLVTNAHPRVPVVNLIEADGLTVRLVDGAGQQEIDPHVWYDPANVQRMAELIRATLTELDPAGAAAYAANAAAYTDELTRLDQEIRQQIASEAGVKVVDDLYAESLGQAGSDGDTYLKAMRHNTRVIVEALR